MVLKVIPATEADVSRAVAIETTAYGPNPIGPFLYPGPFPPKSDNGLNPRCEMLLGLLRADPACRWVKVIDTDIADGEDQMVSFSMWYVWDTPQPPAPPQEWGPGANPEACEMFMGGMRKRRNARFAGKPFVYLKLLHTDPTHQRRGAASMLLQWGADEADRLGLEVYVEASPEGKPLYEKRGFKELETFAADLSKWGGPSTLGTLMLRPASKSA